MDLIERCRLCAKLCNQNGDYLFNDENQNFLDLIAKYISIHISSDDHLPLFICETCKSTLKSFDEYVLRCHDTQNILGTFNKSGSLDEKVAFKIEIKEEDLNYGQDSEELIKTENDVYYNEDFANEDCLPLIERIMTARHLTDEEIAQRVDYDSDIEFERNDDVTDTEDFVEDIESESENEDEGEKLVSTHGFEWSALPVPSSRRRQCNIVTESSGLINGSLLADTLREMFTLFITVDMVREICEETNRKLGRLPGNKIEQVSEEELYAFIGIMLASVRNHNP